METLLTSTPASQDAPHTPWPRAWTRAELAADSSWIHVLSPQAIEGFDRALRHCKSTGRSLLAMTPEDFPLDPAARQAVRAAVDQTQRDYGLCLLRGFPVREWGPQDTRAVTWGIGLHVGVARTQGRESRYISDVRDASGDYRGVNGRGYDTNARLDFHCDFCDLVALMCINGARQGGTSLVTSSMAIHEAFVRRRPDLLQTMFEPFYYSMQGAQAPGAPEYFPCPIFGVKHGRFASRCNRKNVIAAQQRFEQVPRLTPEQIEALDLLDELVASDELCYSMQLAQGDLQLLNNHVTLHSRTEFEDFEEPERKRHLLRLWLALPGGQALPDGWQPGYGSVAPGSVRGGLRGSAITPEFLAYEASAARWHGMIEYGSQGQRS